MDAVDQARPYLPEPLATLAYQLSMYVACDKLREMSPLVWCAVQPILNHATERVSLPFTAAGFRRKINDTASDLAFLVEQDGDERAQQAYRAVMRAVGAVR